MANTIDKMNSYGVSWFKFDESSGNVIDSKGSAVGTISGGVTRVTGWNGQGSALSFNGSNGYVQFNSIVIPAGKKSIRFKIKTNATTNTYFLTNLNQFSTQYGLAMSTRASGQLYIGLGKATAATNFEFISNKNINDGQWHDILFTWDGTTNADGIKLYIDNMNTPDVIYTASSLETVSPSSNLILGRQGTLNVNYFSGQIDELEIYNEVISPIPDKTLIFHNNQYKYLNTSNNVWTAVAQPITSDKYIQYGMSDVSIVPESKWSELTGDIQFCTWTDYQYKERVEINTTVEPFALLEEWDGKQIQLIEYTDNPDQTESSITLETEPFTLEDYLEGNQSLDVLVYTDKEEAPVVYTEIGYSPIDELSDQFDIVTYSESDEELSALSLSVNMLPKQQLLTQSSNILYYGDIQSFVASITSKNQDLSKIRFLLSFDNGSTWKSFRHNKWKNINSNDKFDILKYGMRVNDINSITNTKFKEVLTNGVRIGYYIEERAWTDEDEAINVPKVNSEASVDDIKISDLLYFVVNTLAVINADVKGNKILGTITDEDLGKIQYRVKLNGEFIYPLNGMYTLLQDTPLDLDVSIDNRKIILGANNTIQVDFKDGWGHVESWTKTFLGKPTGLVFSTPSGQYYSNAFGEILQYLNFGTMIAGQTTLDEKVVLSNTLPFTVKDIILTTDIDAQGVEIQLSKTVNPFIAQEGLIYNEELETDESVDFYVRLKLNDNAVGNHFFDINVSADPA